MFDNDIAYTYKKEAEAMLQELEDKDSTIEAMGQERDEAEAALDHTLDVLESTERQLAQKEETIARLQALLASKQGHQLESNARGERKGHRGCRERSK